MTNKYFVHLINSIGLLLLMLSASCAAPEQEKLASAKVENEHPGKQIFNYACAPCHMPNKTLTGPPFQRIREFNGVQWSITWVKHSSELIKRKEPYAQYIFQRYQKIQHTDFPLLQDSLIHAIFDYVDSFPYDSAKYAYRRSAPPVGNAVLDSVVKKYSNNLK